MANYTNEIGERREKITFNVKNATPILLLGISMAASSLVRHSIGIRNCVQNQKKLFNLQTFHTLKFRQLF